MLYAKRTVRCAATGISREKAKASLERQFEGAEVLDISRRGNKWVATILEPKTAEFPPSPPEDEEKNPDAPEPKADGPADDDSSDSKDKPSDSSSDGPPKPEGPPKGEKAELAVLMDLVTQIADKLGIVPGGAAPGAEDVPLPDGPDAPPAGPPGDLPHDGVGGAGHQEIVHRTKLKPGDTPPGVTPIGTPAFASTLSRMASFDAFDDTPGKSIKEAKAELESIYGPYGFKVRQIKRVENGRRLAAKLSRR